MWSLRKLFFVIFFVLFLAPSVIASEASEQLPLSENVEIKKIKLIKNVEFLERYSSALNKYKNLNVKIAYEDFSQIISDYKNNDFYLICIAETMAELGFFDLSDKAFASVSDYEIFQDHINNIKKYYYPVIVPEKSDLLFLSENYSNVTYNDQAEELISNLSNVPELLNKYDWANYLLALGYYSVKNEILAKKYISDALKTNPNSISCKVLKAKIFANEKRCKVSTKILKELNNEQISSSTLSIKIASLDYYLHYLNSKNNFDKNYYLGRFYFIEGDHNKALKTFQVCLSNNKNNNAKAYSMISRCYILKNNYFLAKENAMKAYKISKSNSDALFALAEIENKAGNYKQAIKYYKSASKSKSLKQISTEKIADIYVKLSEPKRATQIYKLLISKYNSSYISYYKLALSEPSNQLRYLKKTLSINLSYQDAWIDLAKIMLDDGNIELAKKYLSVANYLDENNFRYYYYERLLNKKEADLKKLDTAWSK